MEKEFVPYELAVKLKELGFDEECLGYYRTPTKRLIYGYELSITPEKCLELKAPLWQQVFDYFSEKHKINNFVHRYINGQWCFEIFRDDFSDCWEMYFSTKEETRKACLEKLIELVTTKK